MAKRTKEDDLQEALDSLDALHASVLALAGAEHEDEHELATDEDLPHVVLDVGTFKARPERGGLTLDACVTLEATADQAEAIAFSILRQIREGETQIELAIDGRLVVSPDAVADVAGALKAIGR